MSDAEQDDTAHIARSIAQGRRLHSVQATAEAVYWLEDRPDQAGRTQLCQMRHGQADVVSLLTDEQSCRSRVHEYGGGAYAAYDSAVYWINDSDQQIYRWRAAQGSEKLTDHPEYRFADMCLHPEREQLIVVAERHTKDRVDNALYLVDIPSGELTVLQTGADFYAAPRLSPDQQQLAYLSWSLPSMPWHQTTLYLAELLADGRLGASQAVTERTGAICNPLWADAAALIFIADFDQWWLPWQLADGELQPIIEEKAEYGRAMWQLGMSRLALDARCLYAIRGQGGYEQLTAIDLDQATHTPLDSELCAFESLAFGGGHLYTVAASESRDYALYRLQGERLVQVHAVANEPLHATAKALAIEFGAEDQRAHGFFYRATPDACGPLLVVMHGGPTTQARPAYNPLIQFWCQQGFSVLDVNYRGSTGYGRGYRMALAGQWGVVDVEDCVAGAQYVADQGWVDADRMVIRGGSAGGYTVLAALCASDVFAAGGVHYGICDLAMLHAQTHKFESHYLTHLIGDVDQVAERYLERSPLSNLQHINAPVFFSHGELDAVVPVNQAKTMVKALAARELEVALLLFYNERHGYRGAKSLQKLYQQELAFYRRVLDAQ